MKCQKNSKHYKVNSDRQNSTGQIYLALEVYTSATDPSKGVMEIHLPKIGLYPTLYPSSFIPCTVWL